MKPMTTTERLDLLAARLWNENVTDLNYTTKRAKAATAECVSSVVLHKLIDEYPTHLINRIKAIRIRNTAESFNI